MSELGGNQPIRSQLATAEQSSNSGRKLKSTLMVVWKLRCWSDKEGGGKADVGNVHEGASAPVRD